MKTLLTLLISTMALSVFGAAHCVGPTATGSGTGSDWNNQMLLPASPIRGDTYYLAAGYYGSSYSFNTPASGTTTVIIQKATVASHGTATGWNNAFASGPCLWANPTGPAANGTVWSIGGGGYVTFDGQTGTGLDTNNNYGFIIAITNTATLPSGGGNYCFHATQSGPNVTFRSIWFEGPQRSFGLNVPIESVRSLADNIYCTNCFWSDIATAVQYVSGANGGLYEHNYLYRGGSGNAANHSEFFAFQGGCNNVTIRYNVFNTMCGENGSTAYVADTFVGTGSRYVYGNVFGHLSNSGYTGGQTFTEAAPNGTVTTTGGGGGSPTWYVYNNTIIGVNSSLGILYIAAGTMYAADNLIQQCNQGIGTGNIIVNSNIINPGTLVQFVNTNAGNYRLVSHTSAGYILPAPYNQDPDGTLRGTSGFWDIGAYQLVTNTAPYITVQPQSQTILVGANATFSVVASGTPPLTYQWKLGGVNISGATTSSFTTNAVVIGANGNSYTVGVTNASGGLLSSAAVLTVQTGGNNALTNIYVSPTGLTSNTGATTNSPWPLLYAVAHSNPSNTFFFMDGVYTLTGVITPQPYQIFKAINKWGPRFYNISGNTFYADSNTDVSGVTIDGLSFSNCQFYPIYFIRYGMSNITVRNVYARNTGQTWPASAGASGVQIYPGTGMVVEYSLFESNGVNNVPLNHGIYAGGTNGIIRYNVVRYNGGPGIQLYNSGNPINGYKVYGNLVYTNMTTFAGGSEIILECDSNNDTATTNDFWGNTVVNQGQAFPVEFASQGVGRYTNNIILSSGGGLLTVYSPTIRADYNLATSALSNPGAHDVTSSTENFVSRAKGLYWLASGSPARSAALGGVHGALDWFGNSLVSATDIGAVQYTAGLTADARTLDPSSAVGSDYWTNITSGGVAPSITTQPVGTNIQVTQTFTLSVANTGTPPFNYQWLHAGATVQNGTSAVYSRPNAQTNDGGSYSVVVTNVFGTATSSTVTVNVTNPAVAIIGLNPLALNFGLQVVNTPTLLSFSVQNIGSASLSYIASTAVPFSIISGATNNSLPAGQSQTVTVQYAPTTNSYISPDLGTITVTNVSQGGQTNLSATGVAYSIQDITNLSMTLATVLYGFVNSTTGTIYQPFTAYAPNATNNGLCYLGFNLPGPVTNATFQGLIEATNVADNSYWFAVDQYPTDPLMIWDAPTNASPGLVLLPVSWRGNGTESAPQYPTNVWNLSAGNHTVVIVGREANTALGTVSLIQQGQTYLQPPIISVQPQSQVVLAGTPVTFSVVATGTLPLAYQWNFGGTPINGANQTSYQIASPLPPDTGLYQCIVTNAAGATPSFAATLVVTNATPIGVKVHIHGHQ